MSKFIYKMQSILNLKYKLEEQAKMEFAAARKRLTEEEEKLEALILRKGGYEEEGRKLRSAGLHVQKLKENRDAIARMDEFIVWQRASVAAAEKELEKERQKFTKVMQERKVQEKLREKAFEDFLREENARESKEVDELTSYTYGHALADHTGAVGNEGDGNAEY